VLGNDAHAVATGSSCGHVFIWDVHEQLQRARIIQSRGFGSRQGKSGQGVDGHASLLEKDFIDDLPMRTRDDSDDSDDADEDESGLAEKLMYRAATKLSLVDGLHPSAALQATITHCI